MRITVHVHARSSRNEIVETDRGVHAYVTAPPVENKANAAVRDLLSKKIGVSKNQISLVRGAKSKIKEFEISNI